MTVKKYESIKKIDSSNNKNQSNILDKSNIEKSDFVAISKEECSKLLEELSDQYDEAMRELAK